jgi:hypothetical protein
MGIYGLNIDEKTFEAARDLLTRNGAHFAGGFTMTERPPWLARRSTVFYYHDRAQSAAQDIAKAYGERLGIRFALQRGAGLGVRSGEEQVTFFVHIIGKSP